ncbi:MAG TPA: alpha/beta hydrolase [Arthrobacter sp.]|nr:alpha/beta hydrolase [Arthrobacter sp.]
MTLDPELAGLLHHVAGAHSLPELLADPSGTDRLEAFCGGLVPYQSPDVPVRRVEAPGPNGPVPIRIYGGAAAAAVADDSGGGLPALVWMHGGGFSHGDLDMREADQLARELAARASGLVLSVDYRLASGGVHFPVPHEDVVAAWMWAVEHAEELGADPLALCLGGATAGGNLAVGAALYLKDSGRPLPAKLVLAYPFLHGELPPSGPLTAPDLSGLPAVVRFTDDDCRAMVENYIGGPLSLASSYAMPGYADLAGLPPAAILAAEYDDLRFSAELFVDGLRDAGVPVEFRLEPGATHGYLNYSAGLGIVQRGLQFLAEQFARTPESAEGPLGQEPKARA